MAIINQYSYMILAGIVIIVLAVILFRDGIKINDLIALGALVVGLGMGFLLFRPGPSSIDDATDVLTQIGSGQPVLLEFQSNY